MEQRKDRRPGGWTELRRYFFFKMNEFSGALGEGNPGDPAQDESMHPLALASWASPDQIIEQVLESGHRWGC